MLITRIDMAKHETTSWPFTLAPVVQLAARGLPLTSPATFIVGENGVGKSTIIEALADAYGLDVRGGHGGRRYGRTDERTALGSVLRLQLTDRGRRTRQRGSQGFFLRSETALGVFEYMSDWGVPGYGSAHLGAVSHGEGYLQVMQGRFNRPGLYLMDEPESALSFQSCLVLARTIHALTQNGSQVICATHSPVLTALPGASIIELDAGGMRPRSWRDLSFVGSWRDFMRDPHLFWKHLLGP